MLATFGHVIDVLILTLFVCIVIIFARAYMGLQGTFWQRSLAAGRNSATMVWQYLLIAATGIDVAIEWGLNLFADPATVAQIQAYMPPEYVRYFLVFMTLTTVAARWRSLRKAASNA